jgi:hypothetical protein
MPEKVRQSEQQQEEWEVSEVAEWHRPNRISKPRPRLTPLMRKLKTNLKRPFPSVWKGKDIL